MIPDQMIRSVSEIISETELKQRLEKKKSLKIKLGVDPTAPDLHLGHTVVLNILRAFQDLGHQIIFIIGDFTAMIGDPSGQSVTRPKLSAADIKKNAQTYQDQVFKILDQSKTDVRYNSVWLKELGAEGILELGLHYTIQRIMERDDFSKRLKDEKPIALSETYYPLLQGYDSVAVKSDIEIGGTDQKFNLLVGRELQRDNGQDPQIVMTLPLLIGTDGTKKMSKSYQNHIALNDLPQDMFGKIMSVSDKVMMQYYDLLTLEDIEPIKKMHPKEAKMKLAHQITARYHGIERADEAKNHFDKVFSKNSIPEQMEEYSPIKNKIFLSHLLFESGLSSSKRESKRLIESGGVKMDGKSINSDHEIVIQDPIILQVGKRRFKRIVLKKRN